MNYIPFDIARWHKITQKAFSSKKSHMETFACNLKCLEQTKNVFEGGPRSSLERTIHKNILLKLLWCHKNSWRINVIWHGQLLLMAKMYVHKKTYFMHIFIFCKYLWIFGIEDILKKLLIQLWHQIFIPSCVHI